MVKKSTAVKKTKSLPASKQGEELVEKKKKVPEELPVNLEKSSAPARYFESKGGRKTAVARVRLFTKQHQGITINAKDYKEYFRNFDLQKTVLKPLETMNVEDKFGITVKIAGGGLRGQADAVANGIARALTIFNPDFRKRLRRASLLTRDSRMVERKKYGLKKARRAPQWAKR